MREDIIAKIKTAGVVGAGGAGFPTHVKLGASAKTIIVNGAECEPLLKVDQQLMKTMADKLVPALETVIGVTGASEGIIALKAKYTDAIDSLQKVIDGKLIRLHILDDFYPAGDEQVIVYETTGKLVPQGGIPLKVDCVVVNVETLLNIARALDGKPVTETFLTITGIVPDPITCKVPVGMPIKEVLALAEQHDFDGIGVIEGGPMMGKVINDLTQPVTKTTKGLIVLPADHQLLNKKTLPVNKMLRQANTSCVQCRYCTDLCPRYLLGHKIEPHKIMRAISHISGNEEDLKMAFACSECGACEQFSCVMSLSPRTINGLVKRELSKQGVKPDAAPAGQAVNIMREYRKMPVKRLVTRLGLDRFMRNAPLTEKNCTVKEVRIKLKQHVGAPSTPVVKVGQFVQAGDIIAAVPENALGANIHASINGKVTSITDEIVITLVKGGGGV